MLKNVVVKTQKPSVSLKMWFRNAEKNWYMWQQLINLTLKPNIFKYIPLPIGDCKLIVLHVCVLYI